MTRVYGVGIVGAGKIFGEHARAIANLKDSARLIAVADLDEIQLRHTTRAFCVPFAYDDYQLLLQRSDIDIVVVATPPCTHEQIVIDALRSGKYVLCEKPMAHTMAAAIRIAEAAQRWPGRLTFAYQHRFARDLSRILWLKEQGWLGDLHRGRIDRYGEIPVCRSAELSWWGRWDVSGGGAVITQFIHELDFIVRLFGQPSCVRATLDTLHYDIESEDTFEAEISFESGSVVSCSTSLQPTTSSYSTTYSVEGSRGSVQSPWCLTCKDPADERAAKVSLDRTFPPPPPPPSRRLAARAIRKARRVLRMGGNVPSRQAPRLHQLYYAEMFASIENGAELPVPPDEALWSLELCIAIYVAGLTGKQVDLPLELGDEFYDGITAADYAGRGQIRHDSATGTVR